MAKSFIGEFFQEEYSNLKKYIRARFHQLNEYDAEDIIQQTVLKLLYKGDDAFSIVNMSSYMYASLRNGAIDYIKKRKYEVLIDEHIEGQTQTTEDAVLNEELKERIKRAIDSLDEMSRTVFIEIEIKERSYKDLSRETATPVGTLLSRKSRAMKKLARILSDWYQQGGIK